MPNSRNRKHIVIPIPLHEELRARAMQEGTTMTTELIALVKAGKQQEHGTGDATKVEVGAAVS